MDEQVLRELIRLGYETRGVEFKSSGSLKDGYFCAKVVRAILGMANRRDGGIIVLGVEDDHESLLPVGISSTDLAAWTYDDLCDQVARYADPSVELDLSKVDMGGGAFIVIEVRQFYDVPVFCKKPYEREGKQVLRSGLYVRSRRKPETSEIASAEDLRELIELAVDNQVAKWVERTERSGLLARRASSGSDDDVARFAKEAAELS